MYTDIFKSTIENIDILPQMVGQVLGQSDWLVITQQQIDGFAKLTGDEQWIHIDETRAKKESPYGKTIAHGFLILSMASQFTKDCLEIKNVNMVINYGLDRVRFTHPVCAGDAIRGQMVLNDYIAKPYGGRLQYTMTIKIKNVEKPACIAELIGLCYK